MNCNVKSSYCIIIITKSQCVWWGNCEPLVCYHHYYGLHHVTYQDFLFLFHCVFPENIQTPTTEGILVVTPATLQIFHFHMIRLTPSPFQNFQKNICYPQYPLKIIFLPLKAFKSWSKIINHIPPVHRPFFS